MKKLKPLIVILLIVIISASLFACDNNPTVVPAVGEVIAIPEGSYDSLAALLIALDEAGSLELTYTESIYGIMITSIKGVEKELVSDNETRTSIMFYLSSSDVNYIDATITNLLYGDVTYYSAGLGASAMPVIDGVSYLFCTVTFGEDWISSTVNEDAFIILE